ncbi:hypothetical protein QCB44_04265 [Thiomicrorhabdus sp. zzn3]|uniref:hypothetical protein n=1 Tax=Thiomicrorhabdus sp. zzn3 TaxID=3039775 RepID=UPI002437424C|nr:hypothetical protein [Thiomicrorhabdus sp. zzn3]MDG6777917.1 hypothetical protein [Thiomicrorhabdus sp. zzn3]
MPQMNTQQKVQSCLEFIDDRLENHSEQTIRIAEVIIEDIKELTRAYPVALKNGQLKEHLERVRQTQMNWVTQLHEMILDQSDRDINVQVISALQNFVNNLNQNAVKRIDFEVPRALSNTPYSLKKSISQQEMDQLMGQTSLFEYTRTH